MKYFCLCLSPALDVTVELDRDPVDGAVIKNVREQTVPGGKGLNVARYLAMRGADVSCGGILGKEGASYFVEELKKYSIRNLFTEVPGEIRRNEMIVAPSVSYKLNRSAYPAVSEFDVAIDEDSPSETVAVISGSLPVNFAPDYYARLIRRMRALGYAKIVLDASGEPLRLAVFGDGMEGGCAPDMIKPNAEECAGLLGFEHADDASFLKATEILRRRVGEVVISDGGKGAWFNGRFVPAQPVDVRDTTAAGDTLLAEYCFSGDASLAVEAGSQACAIAGSEPPCAWLRSRGLIAPSSRQS